MERPPEVPTDTWWQRLVPSQAYLSVNLGPSSCHLCPLKDSDRCVCMCVGDWGRLVGGGLGLMSFRFPSEKRIFSYFPLLLFLVLRELFFKGITVLFLVRIYLPKILYSKYCLFFKSHEDFLALIW